jgi:hypothetical protein
VEQIYIAQILEGVLESEGKQVYGPSKFLMGCGQEQRYISQPTKSPSKWAVNALRFKRD